MYEKLPYLQHEGSFLFTVQGRIDNRDSLPASWSLKINSQYPDSSIILQAYLKWGKRLHTLLAGVIGALLFLIIKNRSCLCGINGAALLFIITRMRVGLLQAPPLKPFSTPQLSKTAE